MEDKILKIINRQIARTLSNINPQPIAIQDAVKKGFRFAQKDIVELINKEIREYEQGHNQ